MKFYNDFVNWYMIGMLLIYCYFLVLLYDKIL